MKTILYSLTFLLLTICCVGQGAHRISQVLVKGNGIAANVGPYASVTVCTPNTGCSALETIYSDAGLTNQIQNPTTADGSGNYDYYIASGCVDEQISTPNQGTQTLTNVCPFNGVSGGGGGSFPSNAIVFGINSSTARAAVQSDVNPFLTSPGPIGSVAPNTVDSTSDLVSGTTLTCMNPGSFFAGGTCHQVNGLDNGFIYESTPAFISSGTSLFSSGSGGGTFAGRVDALKSDYILMANQGQHYAHERFNFSFGVGDFIPEDWIDYMHGGLAFPSDQGYNGEFQAGGQDPGYFHATIATGGSGAQTLTFTSLNGSGCNALQNTGVCLPSTLSSMIDMSTSLTANIVGTGGNLGQSVAHLTVASAGSGQTNGTFPITGTGGGCDGGGNTPTINVTIAGGAITGATISVASNGCTSAPSFTVAEGGTSGTITASLGGVGGFGQLSQLPTNGSFPVTYAATYSLANIANDTTPDNPKPVTIPNMTGMTLNGVSNMLRAGDKVCVINSNFWEQSVITSVTGSFGSQTVTLPLAYPVLNPTIWDGGICGDDISFDANFSIFGYRTSYPAIGSIFGSDLIYSVPVLGGMNAIQIPQTASEPETTDGGANSGIHLYCSARIVNSGVTFDNVGNWSTLAPRLMPNSCAWPTSGTVEDPDFPVQNVQGKIGIYNMSSASNGDGSESIGNYSISGMGAAFVSYGISISNNQSNTAVYNGGYGGHMVPPIAPYIAGGLWQYGLFMGTAPTGSLLFMASPGALDTYNIFSNGYGAPGISITDSTHTIGLGGNVSIGGNAIVDGSLSAANVNLARLALGGPGEPGEIDFNNGGSTLAKFQTCGDFGGINYLAVTQGGDSNCNYTNGGFSPTGTFGAGALEVDYAAQVNNLTVALPPPVGIPSPVVTCTGSCSTDYQYFLTAMTAGGQEGTINISQGVFIFTNSGPATLSGSNFITLTCPTALQAGYPSGTTYILYVQTTAAIRRLGTCPLGGTVVDTGGGTTVATTPQNGANAAIGAGTYFLPASGNLRVFRSIYSDATDTGFSSPSAGTISFDTTTPGNGLADIIVGNCTGCVGPTGTTATITGTALTASCDSGTASVSGAVVGKPVSVSSTTGVDVGGAFDLRGSVTSSGTVTVYVCGTGTPASLAYNVVVHQ